MLWLIQNDQRCNFLAVHEDSVCCHWVTEASVPAWWHQPICSRRFEGYPFCVSLAKSSTQDGEDDGRTLINLSWCKECGCGCCPWAGRLPGSSLKVPFSLIPVTDQPLFTWCFLFLWTADGTPVPVFWECRKEQQTRPRKIYPQSSQQWWLDLEKQAPDFYFVYGDKFLVCFQLS